MKIIIDPDALQAVHEVFAMAGYTVNITRNVESSEISFELPTGLTEPAARTLVANAVKAWRLRGINAFDPLNIKNLTIAQLNNYIDTNVVDLASAKTVLKRLALLMLYFYKRELNEV